VFANRKNFEGRFGVLVGLPQSVSSGSADPPTEWGRQFDALGLNPE
jgi:hypothetical protein